MTEFLVLAESFGTCMAFIEHDVLILKIFSGWSLYMDGTCLDIKKLKKRNLVLKEGGAKMDPVSAYNCLYLCAYISTYVHFIHIVHKRIKESFRFYST